MADIPQESCSTASGEATTESEGTCNFMRNPDSSDRNIKTMQNTYVDEVTTLKREVLAGRPQQEHERINQENEISKVAHGIVATITSEVSDDIDQWTLPVYNTEASESTDEVDIASECPDDVGEHWETTTDKYDYLKGESEEVSESLVTSEDARRGLQIAILYLESHPEIAAEYVEVLWTVMKHIVNHSVTTDTQDNDYVEGAGLDDEQISDDAKETSEEDTETDDNKHSVHSKPAQSERNNLLTTRSAVTSQRTRATGQKYEAALDTKPEMDPSQDVDSSPVVDNSQDLDSLDEDYSPSKVSKKKRLLVCKRCGKQYKSVKCFNKHLVGHGVVPAGEEINDTLSVIAEKYNANPEDSLVSPIPEVHTCSVCNKTFRTSDYLRRHLVIHTEVKPYKCQECEKSFNDKSTLRKHKRIHSGDRPYQCTTCGKCFIQSNNLKQHSRIHTGEKPYLCEICQRAFTQPSALKVHMSIHTGLRPHICSQCGKSFAQLAHLGSHMLVHTGEKKYKCETCGKKLGSSKALKFHTSIHTGEKRYKCNVCGKAFTASSGLRSHMRTHTGERPYLCPQCGKAFSQSDKVARHMRVHTGERPFACLICGQAFSDTSILRRHKMVHEKKNSGNTSKYVKPRYRPGGSGSLSLNDHCGSEQILYDIRQSQPSHYEPTTATSLSVDRHQSCDGDNTRPLYNQPSIDVSLSLDDHITLAQDNRQPQYT